MKKMFYISFIIESGFLSRVEGQMSSVEGQMLRVEGKLEVY